MSAGRVSCAEVDAALEELALGEVPEPRRGDLLAHVAQCATCRSRLDELVALTDELLLVAPEHEPPPGFESRVLRRLASAGATGRERGRALPRRWLAVAAAVVALLALAGAVVVGRASAPDAATTVVRRGDIVAADGTTNGSVQLIDAAQPFALVTITNPRDRGGVVSCELVGPGGGPVTIGSWDYADVARHVWAVGIDPELLRSTEMHVLGADGSVVATATLR